MSRSSRRDVGHFWDLVVRKWYGSHVNKPNGEWNNIAEIMMLNLAESGPVFRVFNALERGELKSKRGEKKSIHFNGSEETVELILRTVISVNQLSIYETFADLCKEFDPDSRNQTEGKICESLVMSTEIPNANVISQSSASLAQGDLHKYERNIAEFPDGQKLSKLSFDAGFLSEIGKGKFSMRACRDTHNFEI